GVARQRERLPPVAVAATGATARAVAGELRRNLTRVAVTRHHAYSSTGRNIVRSTTSGEPCCLAASRGRRRAFRIREMGEAAAQCRFVSITRHGRRSGRGPRG